jgi:uncharacterized protein YabN with tetrapyrrole methylase and pyrophosphatase domain
MRNVIMGSNKHEVMMKLNSMPAGEIDKPILYLVGAGVCFPEHLTVETIEILSACKRICTNLPQTACELLPEDLSAKCESLWPLYQDKRDRSANYQDVAEAVLGAGERGLPLAWMTPGHPIVFDSVSQLLIRAARARGWQVSVLPAISSLDTILAEIGYDPANGFLVHEATAVVRRQVALQPSITTLLLQPSMFGSDLAHVSGEWQPDLLPLQEYLLRFFAEEQECAFVRSSPRTNIESSIHWTKLTDLAKVEFAALVNSSLLLPSATVTKLP